MFAKVDGYITKCNVTKNLAFFHSNEKYSTTFDINRCLMLKTKFQMFILINILKSYEKFR